MVSTLLKQGKIMRSSEVKRGMTGYALSVFQGTKIEKFPLVVLGNLQKVMGGGDLVLIKITGGPVVTRQSGIIQGMSGSPVYINGKMLGAIAIGFGFPKEPIGGVTPITQMIETALPDNRPPQPPMKLAAAKRDEVYTSDEPLQVAGRSVDRVVVSSDPKRLALSGSTLTMRPCTQYVQLSGISAASLPRWQKMMAPFGFTPVIGGGAMSNNQFTQVFGMPSQKRGVVAPFVPGAAIGVQMVSGDIDMTGVGTVTFRQGQRVLAFGHPMFGLGAVSMPMTTAYVHDIFPAYDISFKLASPIANVGALQQDTAYAIGGTVGRQADTVPMHIGVRDAARHINKNYNVRMIKDPVFTPQLALQVAQEAMTNTFGQDSDKMVSLGLRVQFANGPAIVRRNYVYASDLVLMGGISDLYDVLMLTQLNGFEKGAIKSVDLSVRVEQARKTARIRRIFADRNRAKAGETVKVSVELEPHGANGEIITKQYSIPIAKDAPDGVLRVVAAPASAYWTARSRAGGAPPRPNNLRDLMNSYQVVGAADELSIQASTPQTFLMVDRTKVPNPPITWSRLVPPGPNSFTGVYNEVTEQRDRLDYSLSGMESLAIPVESTRESDRKRPEVASADNPQSSASSTPTQVADAGDAADSTPDEDSDDGSVTTWVNFSGWENNFGFTKQDAVALPTLEEYAARLRQQMARAATAQAKPVIVPVAATPTTTPAPNTTPTPTPSPTPDPAATNIARPVGHWVQQTAADFSRGTLDGTVVTNDGRIVPGAKWDRLASTGEPVAWSVAKDSQGNTYLGTGHRARLFKVTPDGTVTTLYDGPEVAVSALAVDAQNNVYAGVSPGGRVLRFSPGKTDAQIVLATGDVFIHALTFDSQGRLLVAGGGRRGAIYRIENPATTIQNGPLAVPFATTPQEHILSISAFGDAIYAGTGDDAVLYRVDAASGQATALYEVTVPEGNSGGGAMGGGSPQGGMTTITFGGGAAAGGSSMYLLTMAETRTGADGSQVPRQISGAAITGLVAREDGVYFATANSGSIYRWTAVRGVEEIFKTPGRAIYALSGAADGLMAGVGNAPGNHGQVWSVKPSSIATESKGQRLLDAVQAQITSLGAGVAGTANNAAVYTVNFAKAAVFTSNVFDAGQSARWGAIRLNAETAQSIASLETRSGNTLEPDSTWSAWIPVAHTNGEARVASPASRYLQYRVNFAPDQSAGLSRLEVLYRAANRGPSVHWTLPAGGEAISGKKTITWTATDPDKDPLRYRMAIVKDGETPQLVELKNAATASFELDTTKYSDGQYRLRVEASDAARNPEDPLSDAVTSEPFVIDNTAPSLVLPVATKVENGWELRFSGTDALSALAGAEWRLLPAETKAASTPTAKPAAEKTPVARDADNAADDKPAASTTSAANAKPDWQAAAAEDGIFDSKSETVIARVDPDYFFVPGAKLESGAKLEVRLRDAAGNSTTSTVTLP